jgi:hypothetical protein
LREKLFKKKERGNHASSLKSEKGETSNILQDVVKFNWNKLENEID